MTQWTLQYGATEQTFPAWGLARPQIVFNNQAADVLTAVQEGGAVDGALLFPYAAAIKVYFWPDAANEASKIQWFTGDAVKPSRSGSPRSESITYRFEGPFRYFDRRTFMQTTKSYDPSVVGNHLKNVYHSNIILNTRIDGTFQDTNLQIQEIVDYCIANGDPIQRTASFPAINPPRDEIKSITCAEAIRKQIRWMPDAVTWFDYTTTPPTFHCDRRANLAAVALPLTGDALQTIDIEERSDLLVPSVWLQLKITYTINGAAYIQYIDQISPAAATGLESGAFVAPIDLRGITQNFSRATITTVPIDVTSKDWWLTKDPVFKDPNYDYAQISIAPDALPNGHLANELTQGQIPSWMGKSVNRETLTATITYKTVGSTSIGTKKISAQVTTTNAVSGTYTNVVTVDSGDPIPLNLAAALFASMSVLQYDGQHTIVEQECSGRFRPGKVINLTGGLAAWTTMRSTVQNVTEDLEEGRTTINFGHPEHLGFSDLIELMRVSRTRYYQTPLSDRVTAASPANTGVELGQVNADGNSTAGAHRIEKQTIQHPTDPSHQTVTDGGNLTSSKSHQVGDGVSGSLINFGDCAGKLLKVREINVCVDGVDMKQLFHCSDPYLP